METQQLKVNKSDIEEYYKSIGDKSKKAKIWIFRTKIIAEMPGFLKQEFRTKFNDLEKVDFEGKIYKFVAKNCSLELNNYLSQFSIIVED